MLTKDWFKPENAGKLRRHLRQFILHLFVEQTSETTEAYLTAVIDRDELAKQDQSCK